MSPNLRKLLNKLVDSGKFGEIHTHECDSNGTTPFPCNCSIPELITEIEKEIVLVWGEK